MREPISDSDDVSAAERFQCQEDGCNFWSKYKANLKRHVVAVHGKCEVWHVCQEHGCAYRAKRKCHLKGHLASVHGKGLVWYNCNVEGCEYRAKRKSDLASHHSMVHDTEAIWFSCPEPGCKLRAKKQASIKRHIKAVHGIGAGDYPCLFPGCSYWATTKDNLLRHEKRHFSKDGMGSSVSTLSINSVASDSPKTGQAICTEVNSADVEIREWGAFFKCRINECAFQSTSRAEVDRHINDVHLEGNAWFVCRENDCVFRTKNGDEIDAHMMTHENNRVVRTNGTITNATISRTPTSTTVALHPINQHLIPGRMKQVEQEGQEVVASVIPYKETEAR